MECQIRRADHVAELVLIGSLDSSWSSYFSDRIDEVIRSGALEVRLDMEGVSYLSSNGIGILFRYHRQLVKIGGRFRIVADSEAVSHVLKLTGVWQLLHDDGPRPELKSAPAEKCATIDRQGMILQVFAKSGGGQAERLDLMGDPARLCAGGYDARDEITWSAVPEAVSFGLGALGPCFDECRGRFGEFLAVAGVAAYRPTAGPGRPDFEQSAGAFVPKVRVLYGLAFPAGRAAVVRFEAGGEPAGASVPLTQIALACLDLADADTVGLVLAGEAEGLVGAALRKSPAGVPGGVDPFAHPDVRDWLSLTPEPEHSRSTALVVGVATREVTPALSPFVRPVFKGRSPDIQGHFHAAVVPYRPLAGGAIELRSTVAHLFEPGRIDSILHLIGDSRSIVGAGESTFTRGVIWYVPLVAEGGTTRP
jgi:anti-anti-sigma factor